MGVIGITRQHGKRHIDWLMRRNSPYTSIGEPILLHVFRAIDISQINHYRAGHEVADALEVERTELLPFGNDHDGVGLLHAIIRSSTVGHVEEDLPGLIHSNG